jgi:hypothetical protein
MTNRTWLFTFVTTLLILGLAACSGGGDSGSGGGGIPTATNSAITPPPTTAVAITTAGGMTSQANQSIAANAFQASDGALTNAGAPSALVVGVQAGNDAAKRETVAAIVRRHAEKIRDHKSSVTGALQVNTRACTGGGTRTDAFDDANPSVTEVFVNCSEGGQVVHGTISSSNVGFSQDLGSTVGSPYTMTVSASITIDLSVVTMAPASTVVTQSSFNFSIKFFGNMVADGTGGVEPDFPNRIRLAMDGAGLLTSDGPVRELLSSFSIVADANDTLGTTTVTGNYTFASTTIGGSVTVNISPGLVFPQGSDDPISGAVTITSSGSPGASIVLTVISSPVVGVRVVATNGSVTETADLTWAQVEQL